MNTHETLRESGLIRNGNGALTDEQKLVVQAKSGHSSAFGELYERHQLKIYRSAFRILRNEQDAEDAVQQSFQRAFVNLHRFRGDSAFATWVTRIAINEALMMLRRRRVTTPLFETNNDDVNPTSPINLPEHRLLAKQKRHSHREGCFVPSQKRRVRHRQKRCRVMVHTFKQRRNSMAQQSSGGGRPKLSEKGLLTPDNCVVTLIDHQPQMLFGVSNSDRQGIINNVIALAKATRVFELPVVLSTVETKSFSGNMWPQLRAVFPGQEPIERSSMNSWDDKNFVAAIEKTGRKKIVLAGLWTETCVALPTVQAIHDGYEVYVVEDCCGDVSQLAHDNAMKRVIQAGAKPVTALSTMLEWQRDWSLRGTYDAVMDIVKTHMGAYGVGVEYAYTMVHGLPATKFAEYVIPAAAAAHN